MVPFARSHRNCPACREGRRESPARPSPHNPMFSGEGLKQRFSKWEKADRDGWVVTAGITTGGWKPPLGFPYLHGWINRS